MSLKHRLIHIVALVLTLMFSCTPMHYLANQNLDFLYSDSDTRLNPELKIFHPNPDDIRVYVGLNPQNFLPKPKNQSYELSLKYRIYKDYEFSGIVDSGSKKLKGPMPTENPDYLETSFDLPNRDKQYLLEVIVRDKVAENKTRNFAYCRPYSKATTQEYLIRSQPDSEILFDNMIQKNQRISVTHTERGDSIVIDHYRATKFSVAPPPFANDYVNKELGEVALDSSRKLKQGKSFSLKPGTYNIIHIPDDKQGFPAKVLRKPFPELNQSNQLLQPLKYLTSSKAYARLEQMADPKEAVDSFWLEVTNNDKAKAKKLIKQFYGRVEKANRFFSTYKQGWKTDRGMIYLVFGKPYMVYRSNNGEAWIYPESERLPEILFKFRRQNHTLYPAYYEMIRSPHLKDYWFRKVNQIRDGLILRN